MFRSFKSTNLGVDIEECGYRRTWFDWKVTIYHVFELPVGSQRPSNFTLHQNTWTDAINAMCSSENIVCQNSDGLFFNQHIARNIKANHRTNITPMKFNYFAGHSLSIVTMAVRTMSGGKMWSENISWERNIGSTSTAHCKEMLL